MVPCVLISRSISSVYSDSDNVPFLYMISIAFISALYSRTGPRIRSRMDASRSNCAVSPANADDAARNFSAETDPVALASASPVVFALVSTFANASPTLLIAGTALAVSTLIWMLKLIFDLSGVV